MTTIASSVSGSKPSGTRLRMTSFGLPWNIPQSIRTLARAVVSRKRDPVTVRAPPRKVSCIARECATRRIAGTARRAARTSLRREGAALDDTPPRRAGPSLQVDWRPRARRPAASSPSPTSSAIATGWTMPMMSAPGSASGTPSGCRNAAGRRATSSSPHGVVELQLLSVRPSTGSANGKKRYVWPGSKLRSTDVAALPAGPALDQHARGLIGPLPHLRDRDGGPPIPLGGRGHGPDEDDLGLLRRLPAIGGGGMQSGEGGRGRGRSSASRATAASTLDVAEAGHPAGDARARLFGS